MLRINTTGNSSKTSHLIAFLTTCIVFLLPISAFPFPGIFTLKVQGYSPGLDEIKVYDISGRLIRKIEFPEQETTMGGLDTGLREMELPLDLSDLSVGLYLLNVGDEVTERVLISK